MDSLIKSWKVIKRLSTSLSVKNEYLTNTTGKSSHQLLEVPRPSQKVVEVMRIPEKNVNNARISTISARLICQVSNKIGAKKVEQQKQFERTKIYT